MRFAHQLLGADEGRGRRYSFNGSGGTNQSASQKAVDGDGGARRPLLIALIHNNESIGARRQAYRKRAQRKWMRERGSSIIFQLYGNVPRPPRAAMRGGGQARRQGRPGDRRTGQGRDD